MEESGIWWMAFWVNDHLPQLGITAFYTFCIMTFLAIVRERLKQSQRSHNHSKPQELEEENARELCKVESAIDNLHRYGGSITANVMLLKSEVSLQTGLVRKALNHLTRRHPLLRTKIDRVKTRTNNGRKRIVKHFRELENPDFAEFHLKLKARTSDQWLSVLERELQKQFPLEGPLWRFIMLKEQFDPKEGRYRNAFVFSSHQLVCDGTSALTFLEQFLEYLNTGSDGMDQKEETGLLLQPSFSQLMRNQISMSQLTIMFEAGKMLLQGICLRFQSKLKHKNQFTSKFPPTILNDPSLVKKTCLLPRTLSKDETTQLVGLCKANRCTVHGTLAAAATIAMATILQEEPSEQPLCTCVPSSFEVNVRKDCDPEIAPRELGCFAVDCPIEIPIHIGYKKVNIDSGKDLDCVKFWEFAQRSTRIIHEAIMRGEHLHSAKFMNVLHANQAKHLGELSKDNNVAGRMTSLLSISNLGKREVGKNTVKQVFEFDGFYFAVAGHNIGPVYANNIITVNGILHWGFTYYTNVVSEDQARRYSDLVMSTLRKALGKFSDLA